MILPLKYVQGREGKKKENKMALVRQDKIVRYRKSVWLCGRQTPDESNSG